MEPETPITAKMQPKQSGRFFLTLQIILFIVLICGAIYLWLNQQSLLRRSLHLHSTIIRQQQQIMNLQAGLQNLAQPQEKRLRALNEAQYLAQLANINLTFQGNMGVATELLKLAEQQIASANDPTLMAVRQALTGDITSLQSAPKVDIAGIIIKLDSLSQQLPNLPIVPTIHPSPRQPSTMTENKIVPAWQRGLEAMGHALTNVVVVRRLDQPVQPLLPPEKQTYLVMNMQLKLSQAQWAVIHQQVNVYQQNLQQVIHWIKQYFQQNAEITQNVLAQLTELQQTNIKSNGPALTRSLNAIQTALNNASIKS